MKFIRLSREDGSFDKLWSQWDTVCDSYGENFRDFAPSALSELNRLASEPQTPHAGVYGLVDDGQRYLAACQLNSAFLPKYEGKVLRLRHLVLTPAFELSDSSAVDEYVTVLQEVFAGVTMVASTEMPSPHIKLHLRSPADRQFFKEFEVALRRTGVFESVQLLGAWLYISRD